MANRAIDVLRARAFELPVNERAALAHDLLVSLDDTADVDSMDAWDREILRRIDQLDDGTATLVDRAELRRRIRNRIERPRSDRERHHRQQGGRLEHRGSHNFEPAARRTT